ncbi:Flp family type IVb pilin [Maricaulis sp.]|uniref:Flp family type IVb pilin n=1 Tax=Maricaulis sp. TaxID=1486257 RepID=UPI0026057B09|nr:Flp family type IVb pilin [Maricaulis sp.]
MIARLALFLRDTRGATAIEYSMIAVVISIAAVAGLAMIGPAVLGMFQDASAPF